MELARAVAKGAPGSGIDVGVAPPFVYLDAVGQVIAGSKILLGAQDVYFEKSGAFTGEVCAEMLKDLGAKFVLTGHSERRHVLGEPPNLIARKARAAYDGGLIVVHCVGRKAGRTRRQQDLPHRGGADRRTRRRHAGCAADRDRLRARLGHRHRSQRHRRPGRRSHAYIRQLVARRWNKDFADRVRIIYGGSMKPENAKGLMQPAGCRRRVDRRAHHSSPTAFWQL